MSNETYSINEVAEMLNLSVKAVRRLVASGKIVTTKTNNTYRIDKEYFEQNKDSILRSINVWICELGELDSTSRRNQSALKSHLTAVSDRIREPYARAATRRPRRTSYAATVNPEDFLTGSTGNRRFWVIHVENMNLEKILEITPAWAEQLWAQVFQIWKEEPSGFRLTSEERHRTELKTQSGHQPQPHVDNDRDFEFTTGVFEFDGKAISVRFVPDDLVPVLGVLVGTRHDDGKLLRPGRTQFQPSGGEIPKYRIHPI